MKKAVDIALLPSEEINKKCVDINRELLKSIPNDTVFHDGSCLPHISLSMGTIDEKNFPEVEIILKQILKENPIGKLVIKQPRMHLNSAGEQSMGFDIEATEDLQKLHEAVRKKLAHLVSQDVKREEIFNPELITDSSLNYARNFSEKSFENFKPHITLGRGDLKVEGTYPVKFYPSKLVVCHLGSHNTCRTILIDIPLK